MSASQNSGSEGDARENLASPNDQQVGQRVLSPLSGILSVDKELKLRKENFKQTIKDFFKDKNITALSQLTAVPAFPAPYVLAQFASKAYTDYKPGETEAEYETRLALPDGWMFLTNASNTGSNNGYFGAAYWHPEHQQVVIAHRGTDTTSWGAVWTDVQGVLRNKYVRQMESASTFACKVVEVLREIDHKMGTSFQVFFTGHSLGGWLAQITTFTTEYLKTEGYTFLKSDNVPQSYHPHTVVFDSPGCKDMLSQMADKFDVRLDGRSIDIEHLDITSYLSAPNLINTCNAHLGMVYRIFVDLSDMGWLEKHTGLYNLATHSMDRIVEAFDPATGHARKDEHGKLKIQVVIDWPISDGFRRGEEYKRFFDWAKHFNNYHPDISGEILRLKGYYPIRYQTKNYDERVTSLSIFSQEERQFLESYLWLRDFRAFLKPKELFSGLEREEAQEEAVIILQSFEIENDRIRCADASALQALIPYVKRLLQLFPQIKGNTKSVLTSHEIRNKVYQFETNRYIEKIDESPLDFKDDVLNLRDFVSSNQQRVLQLHMTDGDEWTGLVKAYQVLQKTNCLSAGQYTVMKLKRLFTLNILIDFGALMLSTETPYLILVACEANQILNVEREHIISTLFDTIKHKPSIKFILSTRSEDSTVTFLQHIGTKIFGNGFVRRDERLTWSDITTSSQERLLHKTVRFQGTDVALNELVPADSPLAKLLPLAALLDEKQLKIGDPVPISDAYNEAYYIGRTLRHQIAVTQDIFSDKHEDKFPDLLAGTEQEFKQLCEQDPERNVHLLKEDVSGKLFWQQSQGSLETLRKYIDTHSWHTYTPGDLDKLLEQAHKQTVMLISDTAGMGKSTVLTHLSKQIKQKFPAKWVVRIDLNDHTDALRALQEEQIDKKNATEFVMDKLLKLKPGLEMELFKHCCEQKQQVNIVIMLDGFDEISPSYKETVIALLQALRQTAVEQLWVTTRPHLREALEDELQQLSYTLEPFSEDNQVEFLTKFWGLKDWSPEVGSKEKEGQKGKLQIYGKKLIRKLAQSISDKDKEFTGIPLQCRMLAEAFDEEVKTFYHSAETVPELRFKLDLIELYERFLNRKYDICVHEKYKMSMTNVVTEVVREQLVRSIVENHQVLAFRTLFGEEIVDLFQISSQFTSSVEELTRAGIAQVGHERKLHFIHRTFAEYFVAEFLVNQLTKRSNTSQQVQDLLLQKILLEADYRVVRAFINGLLSKFKTSNEVLKQYGNRICDLRRDGILTLYLAAREGNACIVGFLLDSVQSGGHTATVKELLLERDDHGRTAWYLSAECGEARVLDMLWDRAKDNITTEELRNKLFLAKGRPERTAVYVFPSFQIDSSEKTAWHLAAEAGNIKVFRKMCEWAEELLSREDLKSKLLLATTLHGKTAWHYASLRGNVRVLDKLWQWGKEKLTAEELNNNLLLAQDKGKQTAWHVAAMEGNLEALQKLWDWAKEKLTPDDVKNKLLLATAGGGKTAWHYASLRGNIQVLDKLLEWAKEILRPEEVRNVFFLDKDGKEQTVLNVAAERTETLVFDKLWKWATEALTLQEIKKLLLAKDDHEQTVLHVAASRLNTVVFERMWGWAEGKLNPHEVNNELLLAKNHRKETVWHVLANRTDTTTFEELWQWVTVTLGPEDIKKMLLAEDDREQTVLHVASQRLNREVFERMLVWAMESVHPEDYPNE